MSQLIFLDTGPLGSLTNPKRPPATRDILQWAREHLQAGNRLMVPSIADFEVRRELVRLGRTRSIAMLDLWNSSPVDRYVPLHDSALRLAANLWANARNAGTPTADPKELDCDVLIAAQALNYQQTSGLDNHTLVIATVNVAHLSRFCTAELGPNILP